MPLRRVIKHNERYNCIRRQNSFVFLLQLKSWSARGAFYHPDFMGYWPTISHTFLTLSTQWVSSPPSRKWSRGVSPRFHRIILCLVWIKRIRQGQGSLGFSCVTPVVETFLDRVLFRIPSNISNGAPFLNPYRSLLGLQLKLMASEFLSLCSMLSFFPRKWTFFVLLFVWHFLGICQNLFVETSL